MFQRISILLVSLFSVSAFAAGATSPTDIDPSSMKVTLIEEGPVVSGTFLVDEYLNRNDCLPTVERFDVAEIMAIGEKIWQIVKDGAPVLNFTTFSASAIPQNSVCPFNMAGWSMPQSKTFELTYKNLLGMEVVNFRYKLIYSYGGSFEGRGAYLANVSVHPADIHVAWGQSFDASVAIANVLNVGSTQDPVAGMQVNLEWNVGNALNKFKSQRIYFVNGRGEAVEL